jgi:hypothetical protein
MKFWLLSAGIFVFVAYYLVKGDQGDTSAITDEEYKELLTDKDFEQGLSKVVARKDQQTPKPDVMNADSYNPDLRPQGEPLTKDKEIENLEIQIIQDESILQTMLDNEQFEEHAEFQDHVDRKRQRLQEQKNGE